MADNRKIDKIAKLRNRDFASERAEVTMIEVLCRKFYFSAVDLEREWLERNKRRGDNNLDVSGSV